MPLLLEQGRGHGEQGHAGWGGEGLPYPPLPGLPRTTLLQAPPSLSLYLQHFLLVTVAQIDKDQRVIEQTVLHLLVQPGIGGEAGGMVNL